MHFFNFRMNDLLYKLCFEKGNQYILFADTGLDDQQGVPYFEAVCSSDQHAALSMAATWHYERFGREEGVCAYRIYDSEVVKKGVQLGSMETGAERN